VEKVKLHRDDIILGKPMLWNIYRSDGSILLKKGLRITSEKNLDRLMQNELLRDADNDADQPTPSIAESTSESAAQTEEQASLQKPSNPFEWINLFALQLKQIFINIEAGKIGTAEQIKKLATNIQKLSDAYNNQFVCAVHMYYPHTYSLMQPIYSALLCDMTAKILDYNEQQRTSICTAALTANIGMYSYQETLNNQASPLTESQREELHLHPYQSVQMLKAINVEDETWLTAIAGHHECNDGSGYPAQITSNTIKPESKIINLADSYLAMISKRSYSNTKPPKLALQEIYTSASASASDKDQVIYLAFIKALGIFPPGTYVKLANNEIGIVTKNSDTSTLQCTVSSICNENNEMLNSPVERDTEEEKFHIKESYAPAKNMQVDPVVLWGYKK